MSDHSSDVIAAFQRELKKRKVEILLNTEVQELVLEEIREEPYDGAGQKDGAESCDSDNEYTKLRDIRQGKTRMAGVRLKNGKVLPGDSCIVCTGGISYPSTGSTGDGYRFAKETGHILTERTPSLVPFLIKESWCARLMGLSLKTFR